MRARAPRAPASTTARGFFMARICRWNNGVGRLGRNKVIGRENSHQLSSPSVLRRVNECTLFDDDECTTFDASEDLPSACMQVTTVSRLKG